MRRSPGEGNGYPLQYSCLEKPIESSLVGYSPWGHKESDMTDFCFMGARNLRRKHLPEMVTKSLPFVDPWEWGWQKAKTRAGSGLDSLYPFPDVHTFGARDRRLGGRR